MRMRIYHNLDNNQLEAYVLADENRAVSGQKKGIREALPDCVAELQTLRLDLSAGNVATIYADGYGAIVVTWNKYNLSDDVQLHAGSRERLCNRKLVRNRDIEARTSDADGLASALAAVLRSEAACRRANDLDTAARFEYPAECRDCKRVASWQSTRWTRPTPLAETPADDAADDDADTTDDVAQAETVIVEPVEVEHDGVVDVEMVDTAGTSAVSAEHEPVTPEHIGLAAGYYRDNGSRHRLWYVGVEPLAIWVCAWEGQREETWLPAPRGFKDTKDWNEHLPELRASLTPVPAPYEPSECMRTTWIPMTTPADVERGWRMTPSGVAYRGVRAADVAPTPAPRAVVSAPVLPAECSADTVEIPEVPPQTNEDARVLAVSEAVIPTIARVRDVFPDVPYRAVHAIRRVVESRDGTVSKKKVAYVFRHGDEIQVLRRDRYENSGRDEAVEAEIAAHVARLQRAA